MQVPNLEAPSVQEQPLPGRAYPRFSDEAPEAAFGEPVGRGLAQVAQVGVEQEAQHKQQNDQLRVVDAMTQLSAAHDALLYGRDGEAGAFSLHGVDAINMPGKFLPAYSDIAGKIAATLTPDQQRLFTPHVQTGQRELGLQLNRYEFEESNRLAKQTYIAGQEQAISSAGLNYRDPHLIQKSILDLHALNTMQAQREGWTPVEQHQALVGSIARMHAGVIDSMLADDNATAARQYYTAHRDDLVEFNPKVADQIDKQIKAGIVQQTANGVLAAYQSGQENGAQALRGIGEKGLTPVEQGQVQGLVNRGLTERAESLQQDPKNQAQIRWLDSQIAGRAVSPSALGTVDSLVRRGVYTFQQGEVKRDEVLRALRVGQEKQEAFAYVADAYKNGTKLDPKSDSKAVADFFYENVPDKPGTSAYNAFTAELTARVGVMPEPAAEYMRAQLASGAPPEAVKAARLADAIDKTNHVAYEYGTDARLRSMAYGINAAASAGADPEGAVEHEREIGKIDEARKKQLDQDWGRQLPHGQTWDQFDATTIRSSLAQDEHYTEPGTLFGRDTSTVPAIPGAMRGEFASLSKQYFYLRDGNIQQARELAMRDLKRVWGVSEVNGQRELMKFAPERLFPDLPTADIRNDLAKEGYGAARLQESDETASSGGRRWNLAEPDQFGFPTVVRGDDNRPLRYQLPQPSKPYSWEREYEADQKRLALQVQRERENRTAEEGGDIASTRMPHF